MNGGLPMRVLYFKCKKYRSNWEYRVSLAEQIETILENLTEEEPSDEEIQIIEDYEKRVKMGKVDLRPLDELLKKLRC
ncbi:hypothetical protein IPA_02180 [Ignicoccus pacificus DSM 13166]|uniref:Uncharacterized protein n=1 Tax=Ignicoccus pacificus DSM 13166 TaxID=940294 RepID=A0A977PJV7_9CREN|nr:hypothetical protein IPA_02180 [Ignicoccus pacificus DSM 13166]